MCKAYLWFSLYGFNEARNSKAENCLQPKGQGEGQLKHKVGNWGEGEQPAGQNFHFGQHRTLTKFFGLTKNNIITEKFGEMPS